MPPGSGQSHPSLVSRNVNQMGDLWQPYECTARHCHTSERFDDDLISVAETTRCYMKENGERRNCLKGMTRS